MFRTALRNVLVMLGVAFPVLLVSAMLLGWLGDGARGRPPLDDLVGSFVFLYAMWVLPAFAIAVVHQLIIATVPRDWNVRRTRLVFLASSLSIAGLIAAYVAFASTSERGWAVAYALLPSAIVYGGLVKPLRSR